jgi:TonB family protein
LAAQPAIGAPGANRLADGTPIAEGADFVAPVPVGGRMPRVRYPTQLAAAGIQGHFEADVVVSGNGDVLDVIVKRRFHRQLDKGIVNLLRHVSFQPATLNGVPVAAIYRASYEFFIQ